MSRILFACFNTSDHATISPLLVHLKRAGHVTGMLLSLENPPNPNRQFRENVYECELTGIDDAAGLDDSVARFEVAKQNGEHNAWLCRILEELYPSLAIRFPFQVSRWLPQFVRFAEATFESFRPDCVVIALGRIDTLIAQRLCASFGVACAYLLPMFYEFKSAEPFLVMHDKQCDDPYFVSGEYGRRRLLARDVPDEVICITGNPAFDQYFAIKDSFRSQRTASGKNREHTILYTMQAIPEDQRLISLLENYLKRREGVRLIARFHPATSSQKRASIEGSIRSDGVCQRISFSHNSSLKDDLLRSSVLATVSSLCAIDALVLGIPVICWAPSFLPEEAPFVIDHKAVLARDAHQLYDAFDEALDGTIRGSCSACESSAAEYIFEGPVIASERIREEIERLIPLSSVGL